MGCCCCGGNNKDMRDIVREEYGKIAQKGGTCCGETAFGGTASPESVATGIGYEKEDLVGLPTEANMGLSCGNPTAIASLAPGETVLDLGSGGGFDVFIAARKVGQTGKAIGVDMTPEMLAKARKNALSFKAASGLDNVDFRLGEIENLPVADASADVVISNCVINLSPDKERVWREIYRVLKPGGRISVSDLALLRPLPDVVKNSMEAMVGCVAGAVLVEETNQMLTAAGFVDVSLNCKSQYIDQMCNWSDPLYRDISEKLPAGTKPSDFVTSLDVTARKS